ncbi:hypothetical protein [Novosphingobium sp. AP12]|uniref:hypothetical protein n=1 Tax=Novosphingobium sp. AP12 TaxID=1144305 RepID=UPI000271DE02|nr:hypothetical protein [Novosphingobium sp. AP12]EJL21900.1 hypothetical protein PMI02_04885 [Novosphingobium sp. AP12]
MARSARRSRGFVCVPRFTARPTITGTAQVGQTLTGASGTIADGSDTSRRWLRNGVAIAAATATTYVVQAADVGATLTYEVTATGTRNSANTARGVSLPTAAAIA